MVAAISLPLRTTPSYVLSLLVLRTHWPELPKASPRLASYVNVVGQYTTLNVLPNHLNARTAKAPTQLHSKSVTGICLKERL